MLAIQRAYELIPELCPICPRRQHPAREQTLNYVI
jgi:hypothetical protein